MTPFPRSLAGRTALVLVGALVVVQTGGLIFYGTERDELQRLADARDTAKRVVGLYRSVVTQPAESWPALLHDAESVPGIRFHLDATGPREEAPAASPEVQRLVRPYLTFGAVPVALRPRAVLVRGNYATGAVLLIGLQLPDERWINTRVKPPPPRPWASLRFMTAFAAMTGAAALLATWAVRRLTAPVRLLAAAAERLGRDVNSAPLPEEGPTEVAAAAAAFNRMAARIRRTVADRTFMLTAVGHDLRTPITRLKLRAEWMDDEEQRRKMLLDLDELEAMVAAVLALGRDAEESEPAARLDLPALLRTVLDEAADARPGSEQLMSYAGPESLGITARPVALKRAVANLVANALNYGGAAEVVLHRPAQGQGQSQGQVSFEIADRGPGIAPGDMERVFEPFQRLEVSRNRETGGTGLGLTITRNILRAHGGDVALQNRPGGGLRALVTLPA